MKLLYYVGIEQQLLSSTTTLDAFLKLPFQRKYQCREKFYQNIGLLDSYLATHTLFLEEEEISILKGFRKNIRSDFIILKCLTQHAIFIDSKTDAIYAVKALHDRFDEFFHRFPVYCSTALIPFKDTIIYDGFISTHGNILLGPGISSSMTLKYKQARKKDAIVTSLQ